MGFTQNDALQKLAWIATSLSQDGWDGYDALPIPGQVVNRAEDILRQLVAIPFVSAAPDDSDCRSVTIVPWKESEKV